MCARSTPSPRCSHDLVEDTNVCRDGGPFTYSATAGRTLSHPDRLCTPSESRLESQRPGTLSGILTLANRTLEYMHKGRPGKFVAGAHSSTSHNRPYLRRQTAKQKTLHGVWKLDQRLSQRVWNSRWSPGLAGSSACLRPGIPDVTV